ncbi:MAG: hypothetical protein KGM96_15685 [Acidobacteriota bacterium]|nr:hypothetical protein [Acidobacteriota bacterium]
MFIVAIGVVFGLAVATLPLRGQDTGELTAEGYVTAVNPPSAFDVNGHHITTSARTSYGILGVNHSETNSPLAAKIQVGTYLQVTGTPDRHAKSLAATLVQLRDDANEKVLSFGVIVKVLFAGAEPVYQADGYSVRITGATVKAFHGTLHSLADVAPGIWLNCEGTRGKDGVVTATKAAFYRVKHKAGQSRNGSSEDSLEFVPPTYPSDDGKTPGKDGKVHLGLTKRSHKIPADRSMQGRVQRVGDRIVPAYQQALPSGDPSKLNFRFFAVDAPTVDAPIATSEGLVLVPRHIAERLQSDDELAAFMADGVALLLQSPTINSKVLAFEGVANALNPGLLFTGLGLLELDAAHSAAIQLEQQRWRIALSLVDDAGYDPWRAPEAWRIAMAKKFPKDISTLKYPDVSGYQLGILNLQYRKPQGKQTASNKTDQQSSH